MSRPMPEHGTRACYLRGCRRTECRNANRAYCKQYRNRSFKAAGALRIDATAAIKRCQTLAAQGWSERQIADAASVNARVVNRLLNGASDNVNPGITRKLLNARPQNAGEEPRGLIDATGTIRRTRALIAIGHTIQDIADAIDGCSKQLGSTVRGEHKLVRAGTAHRVAALYETWAKQPGACMKARRTAERRCWHGPDAWDDDIDDPSAQPYAELHLSHSKQSRERVNEVLLLADGGVLKNEIADRVGLGLCRVEEILREHRPVLVRQIKAASDAERGNHQRRSAA